MKRNLHKQRKIESGPKEDPAEHLTAEGTPALHGGKLLHLGRAQEQQWLKRSVPCKSVGRASV